MLTFFLSSLCLAYTHFESSGKLRLCHGRLAVHVAAAAANLFPAESRRILELRIDADIHHRKLSIVSSREHADACAATETIEHHLRGDFSRIRAHSFLSDAMIGGKTISRSEEH